jgi:hypothetical protein
MVDAGWVRVYHPDQVDHVPDPDEPDDARMIGTVTSESFELVWKRRGFVDLDEVLEASSPEDMPEKATERIAWIDEDPALAHVRAQTALEDEEARGEHARSSVVDHAESVIEEHTSLEDETIADDTSPEG